MTEQQQVGQQKFLRVKVHGMGEWLWDAQIDTRRAYIIKAETGRGVSGFFDGLEDLDPDCVQTLVWMCRIEAGDQIARKAVNFVIIGGFEVEEVDPAQPGPTSAPPAAGTTPALGEMPTSTPLPASANTHPTTLTV